MTGLLGGGHAVYFDGEEAWNLDCFVDVPSGEGAPPVELQRSVRRGARPLRGRAGDVRRPGPPARARRAAPALRPPALAAARRAGAAAGARGRRRCRPPTPPASRCSAPVFTMQPDGERIYAPAGRLLEAGETLAQPGLATALELLADEGADSVYAGSIAELLTAVEGVPVTAADLARYEARWEAPVEVGVARAPRPHARRPVGRAGDARAAAAPARVWTRRRACTRCSARSPRAEADGHTTNLVTADADGARLRADLEPRPRHRRLPPRPRRAAEQHARRGRPRPGAAPAGRADGEHDGADARVRRRASSWRSAQPAAPGSGRRSSASRRGSSTRGSIRSTAVERPRFHRAGDVVNAEPGVDERALDELTRAGLLRPALAGRCTTTSAASA